MRFSLFFLFQTTGSDHLALRQPGDQTIRQRKRRVS